MHGAQDLASGIGNPKLMTCMTVWIEFFFAVSVPPQKPASTSDTGNCSYCRRLFLSCCLSKVSTAPEFPHLRHFQLEATLASNSAFSGVLCLRYCPPFQGLRIITCLSNETGLCDVRSDCFLWDSPGNSPGLGSINFTFTAEICASMRVASSEPRPHALCVACLHLCGMHKTSRPEPDVHLSADL
jgi:hypothetical protein